MKKPTDIGLNRTGMATSPIDSREMVTGALEGTPEQSFDVLPIKQVRDQYAEGAPPIGTMPPPSNLKGVAVSAVEGIQGKSANLLLDLLGERLAFERSGTRLYEALLTKFEASHAHENGPTLAELESIRDDELEHFGICQQAIEALGGDPTVVTPSADIVAVASLGWVQVLCDPRTTLTEALKVILMAELTDNDGWETLAKIAGEMGQEELAQSCARAFREEQDHLRRVRGWIELALAAQAGVGDSSVAQPADRA